MNNPVVSYFTIVSVGVLLAVGWLAIIDLRQGKKFRFDLSANKQKAVLTPKAARIAFSWRVLPTAIVLCLGIFYHLPVLTVFALLSFGLNIAILTRVLRLCKVRAVVE